ncbi:QueT transporter family protein [Virgibacillus sp. W0430]|uniref:QueT transporter family protein n=1 Tax=Virgibacillus sp. W0430 TaxID=3391580 RepID=UPI003F453477
MNSRTLVVNALIGALYVVVTWLIAPFGFTHIQFRISELFNHLVVFDKKYFFGIVLGVFFANLFFSPMVAYDLLFGLSHTIFSLLITIFAARFITNKIALMGINTIVFSFNMYIIALMLKLVLEIDLSFLFIWLTTAAGEFIVMTIAIPIVYALNKRLKFNQLV